jgi:hypothetical protein
MNGEHPKSLSRERGRDRKGACLRLVTDFAEAWGLGVQEGHRLAGLVPLLLLLAQVAQRLHIVLLRVKLRLAPDIGPPPNLTWPCTPLPFEIRVSQDLSLVFFDFI